MTEDKLLFVSCHVKQANIYDLLRLLEVAKVGNVEVRPVAPLLALPAPASNPKIRGAARKAVAAAMPFKQKMSPAQIADAIGLNKKTVYSAITALMAIKVLRRAGHGVYMRVQEA